MRRTGLKLLVMLATLLGLAATGATAKSLVMKLKWHRVMIPASCRPTALVGLPRVLCSGVSYGSTSDTYPVYNLDRHTSQQIVLPASFPLVAVGADWAEGVNAGCDVNIKGCDPIILFQNLQTGQTQQGLAGYQPGGNVIPDLDSPSLAKTLCRPLQLGEGEAVGYGSPPVGFIAAAGEFAVVEEATGIGGSTPPTDNYYLERCGTHWRHRVVGPGAINLHAVVFGFPSGGLLLPSLQPFTIQLTPALRRFTTVALGAKALYALDDHHHVWTAQFPVSHS